MNESPQDEAEVKSPRGWSARVRGRDTLMTILALACTAFIWVTEEQRAKVFLYNHQTTQTLLSQVINNQAKIIDHLQRASTDAAEQAAIQTYVITLSQQQRDALNLSMPDALRRRIRLGPP